MTGTKVYDAALDLLGIRLADGNAPSTAADLRVRAVSIINILIGENAGLDSLIKGEEAPPCYIDSLDEEIATHDKITASAFPFGLASMLVFAEDSDLADVMQSRYFNALHRIRTELAATQLDIRDEYGGTLW